ncbi:tumor necrosis factor receptor superfamily member 14-like [Sander lucioperca]|uniref:tumor necrosis factor receptor superfamily member 14-like n=1 Tax=Sander lucioperca TaxID=283035 RepID=UPI00125E40C2|nr:tumor necrosis factor receptor superfamily member 14-like [Sander lucioperca]
MMLRKLLTVQLTILVFSVFRGHTLTCHRTEYENGDLCCPRCPAGSRVRKHCKEFGTSCLNCDEGTFMDQPTGLTECFPCARCDSGSGLKIKTACRTTSDTVCEPLEGFYCKDSSEKGCVEAQKHRSCQPGQYISQNGTVLRDTECSDCSDGTFSDGTLLTSCQPHTQCQHQLIKPGTASTDAECGEQSSGAVIVIVVPVICLVVAGISLLVVLILRKKGRCKYTVKRNADNQQQYFKKNKHPHEEEQLGVAVINEHRDSSSDTAEESSSKSRTKYVTAPGSSLITSAPSLSPVHVAACTVSSPCVEHLKGQHLPIPVITSHRSHRHHVSEGRYHQRSNTWPLPPRPLASTEATPDQASVRTALLNARSLTSKTFLLKDVFF